jgi:Ser/Thr protein kinase RdoA (MazF antagonist)
MLLVEPLAGEPVGGLSGRPLVRAHHVLGRGVGQLHALPAPAAGPQNRLTVDRLRAAAELIGRARPDAAGQAASLLAALERREEAAGDRVLVHGDLHAKNALVDDGRLALVDLDQAGTGAAAVDLGSALAALRYAAIVGALPVVTANDCARELLKGYSESRALPAASALRWHTSAALLAERACRAVHRVRRPGLERLGSILADAGAVLDG